MVILWVLQGPEGLHMDFKGQKLNTLSNSLGIENGLHKKNFDTPFLYKNVFGGAQINTKVSL